MFEDIALSAWAALDGTNWGNYQAHMILGNIADLADLYSKARAVPNPVFEEWRYEAKWLRQILIAREK
jgi:hypothetical protein